MPKNKCIDCGKLCTSIRCRACYRKSGKRSYCIHCGKETSRPEIKRCWKCFQKSLSWKYNCIYCGKRCTKGYNVCWDCYSKNRKPEKVYCIDCGEEIKKGKRCQKCFGIKKGKEQLGPNNCNWNPNREEVFAPYTEKHYDKEIRKQILEEQDRLCGYCRSKGNYSLHFHHIDYNKQNDERWNKIFLCNICHGKTQGNFENRKFWQGKLENLNISYIRR